MSEEELIDDLKYRTDYGSFEDFDKVSKLIDLYNKEKEKNKKLEKEIFELNKEMTDFADQWLHKDKIREILKYYGDTPTDNPDTVIAFYSDIKKLLEGKNE